MELKARFGIRSYAFSSSIVLYGVGQAPGWRILSYKAADVGDHVVTQGFFYLITAL